jgi:putative redox protein
MSNVLAAIHAREAPIADVRVKVEAVLDGTPERMTAFTLYVTARTDDSELLQKIVTISERACIVTNTLKGVAPITVVVTAESS